MESEIRLNINLDNINSFIQFNNYVSGLHNTEKMFLLQSWGVINQFQCIDKHHQSEIILFKTTATVIGYRFACRNCTDVPFVYTCKKNHPKRNMILQRDAHVELDLRHICTKCKTTKSIFANSFFEKKSTNLQMILNLLYTWAMNYSVQNTRRLLGCKHNATIVQWHQYCRDICSTQLMKIWSSGFQLGGPGRTVEIDESVFVKRKYNRGRLPRTWIKGNDENEADMRWIFGIYDRTLRIGILVYVEKRDTATLLPIIEKYVMPGTTIISDQWRAYSAIQTTGLYQHMTVNHSRNFVDPESGAYTQNIEAFWSRGKKFLRKKDVLKNKSMLPSHLDEFMWRNLYDEGEPTTTFLTLINHLSSWDLHN